MGVNELIQIGVKLKRARMSKGISQRAMATQLGLAYSTYSNYENGHREPGRDIIERACEILGIDVDTLFWDYLNLEEGLQQEEYLKPYSVNMTQGTDGEIIRNIGLLNSTGRERALEYIRYLCQNPEYRNP